MATLNWKTPNGTTGSIDLSKISLDDGSFTIHAKNASSDYTLVGSHAHPEGRLVWDGRYFKVGPNALASMAESTNGDAVFYNNTQDEEGGGTSGTARLYGSPTFDTCASVVVNGIDHPTNPGKFVLYARTASDYSVLSGNPEDRTLYWNSSPVLTTQSDLAAAKITGAVPITHGGTGATTRLTAAKALTNENVGTDGTYFITMTQNWANFGYSSVATAKTMLGLGSAAYTASTSYTPIAKSVGGTQRPVYTNSSGVITACTATGSAGGLEGVSAKSVGTNGYVSFSSGLKVQWGHVDTSDTAYKKVTFSIAFSAVPAIVVNLKANSTTTSGVAYVTKMHTPAKDSFYIVCQDISGDHVYSRTVHWVAIGY